MSFVDLNRSGVALMEIVSKPDIRSSDEARAFLTKLRSILRYLGTSDADMEKGNLRADVNVSVRRPGEPLGTRCEIKNVNSIRFAGQAIESRGAAADRDPRGRRHDRPGDAALRSRRAARRARCAPRRRRTTTATSPTRTCCRWSSTTPMSRRCAKDLPELPDAKRARFVGDYGALRLRRRRARRGRATVAEFFEDVARGRDGKQAANWVINELLGALNRAGLEHRSVAGFRRAARRAARPAEATARSPARSPRKCSRSCSPRAATRARSSRRAG